jgi:glycosyltransferase involved in cell wall biosynthesis
MDRRSVSGYQSDVRFSIVTPSFNQGRFIRDCIESVKSQTGVEWEHIVVDAGSTDETLAVLKEYPHLQWTAEPDRGMSDGINKGFRRATGDWLMWLNTDDYLLPGALAKVAACAAQTPDADVIYGDCLFVDREKHLIRRKRDHRFDFGVLLFYGCYIQSTATFLRRRIITAGHLLDVNYRVCMDFEYYVRLAMQGYRFRHLPEPLAGFRWHETNTSAVQRQRRRVERLQVQRDCLDLLGYGWLGRTWILSVLARVFQAKRVCLRAWTPAGSTG